MRNQGRLIRLTPYAHVRQAACDGPHQILNIRAHHPSQSTRHACAAHCGTCPLPMALSRSTLATVPDATRGIICSSSRPAGCDGSLSHHPAPAPCHRSNSCLSIAPRLLQAAGQFINHSTQSGLSCPPGSTPARNNAPGMLSWSICEGGSALFLLSFTVGVGHISRALTASINVPPSRPLRGVTRPPFVPRLAVGVGHAFTAAGSPFLGLLVSKFPRFSASLAFGVGHLVGVFTTCARLTPVIRSVIVPPRPPSVAVGVGQNPAPLPPVGRADIRRSDNTACAPILHDPTCPPNATCCDSSRKASASSAVSCLKRPCPCDEPANSLASNTARSILSCSFLPGADTNQSSHPVSRNWPTDTTLSRTSDSKIVPNPSIDHLIIAALSSPRRTADTARPAMALFVPTSCLPCSLSFDPYSLPAVRCSDIAGRHDAPITAEPHFGKVSEHADKASSHKER